MVFVKASKGDTTDSVIRKFIKKVISTGLVLEIKDKEYYQKPAESRNQRKSEIRRRQKARKRARKRKNR